MSSTIPITSRPRRRAAAFLTTNMAWLWMRQAGGDTHIDDRLGRLALTDQSLVARDNLVAWLALEAGIALASTLGGGYGTDRMAVARRHAHAIITLAGAVRCPSDARP